MTRGFAFLLAFALSGVAHAESVRISVLPPLFDVEARRGQTEVLRGFCRSVEARLLERYEVDLLSRSDVSAQVFDSGINAMQASEGNDFRLASADFLIQGVFSSEPPRLRFYPIAIERNIVPGSAVDIALPSEADLDYDALLNSAVRELAEQFHLEERNAGKPSGREPAPETELVVAVLPESLSGLQKWRDAKALTLAVSGELESNLSVIEGVQLVDRERIDRLLEEAQLRDRTSELSSVTQFTGADVAFIASVYPASSTRLITSLLVIDAKTGLAFDGWVGFREDLTEDVVEGIYARLVDGLPKLSSRLLPRADRSDRLLWESKYLVSRIANTLGLRMSLESELIYDLALAQAAVGLSSEAEDDIFFPIVREVMLKVANRPKLPFYEAFYPLESKDNFQFTHRAQYEEWQSSFRRHFYQTIQRVGSRVTLDTISAQAVFWNCAGEPKRTLQILSSPEVERFQNDVDVYYDYAYALAHTGQYKEAIEVVLDRGRFSPSAMLLVSDCYRSLGDETREYSLLKRNARNVRAIDARFRLFDLAERLDESSAIPEIWESICRTGTGVDHPGLVSRLLDVLQRSGRDDEAYGVAQSFLIRKEQLGHDISEEILERSRIILGERELSTKPAAVNPMGDNVVIEIFGEEGYSESFAKDGARYLSDFLGCAVHWYPEMFSLEDSESYDQVKTSLNAPAEIKVWCHFDQENTPRVIERILLTNRKLTYRTSRTGSLDVFSTASGGVRLLSTYYLNRFPDRAKRSKGENIAILMGFSSILRKAICDRAEEEGNETIPIFVKPFVLAYNDYLHNAGIVLEMNPANLSVYSSLRPSDLRRTFQTQTESVRRKTAPPTGIDRDRLLRAMERYDNTTPLVILPTEIGSE